MTIILWPTQHLQINHEENQETIEKQLKINPSNGYERLSPLPRDKHESSHPKSSSTDRNR